MDSKAYVVFLLLAKVSVILAASDAELFRLASDNNMTTYVSTESYVYHIEPDKFIGGNLLFADLSSMKTTDGNTNNIIAGVAMTSGYVEGVGSFARFTRISSFLQMNASQVLVVDTNSHCLRSVDRTTGTTSTFLGVCTKAGYANDARKLSLFRNPWSVMHNSMNLEEYIISDWNNNALRVYDTKTEVVTTLVKEPPLQVEFYPSGMGQNSKTGDIYISSTYTHAVFHFNYATKALSLVAGTGSYGFSEGPFLSAKFEYPYELLLIDGRQKLLVADEDNGRIRILDLDANTTASVCDGAKTTVDGNLQRCSVRYPYSLLVIGDTLFIGGLRKIRQIKGSVLPVFQELYITARYNLSCGLLSDRLTFDALQSVANSNFKQIRLLCQQDCSTETAAKPSISCSGYNLTISWPIAVPYVGNAKDALVLTRQRLASRLRGDVASLLHIFIITANPPLVYPLVDKYGFNARVDLTA